MSKYNWDILSNLQLGECAEYFVRMEFMLSGFDVYGSEVDEHGIDLVVHRNAGPYYEIQVKSARKLNYIFFPKDKFVLRKSLLAAVVLFFNGEPPRLYLIPSLAWNEPNELLRSRDYEGGKSNPEWGLNLSQKNLDLLDSFEFEKEIKEL